MVFNFYSQINMSIEASPANAKGASGEYQLDSAGRDGGPGIEPPEFSTSPKSLEPWQFFNDTSAAPKFNNPRRTRTDISLEVRQSAERDGPLAGKNSLHLTTE